jgi:dienelactone hydrolase
VPSRIEAIPLRTRTVAGDEFLRGDVEGREALVAGELRLPGGIPPDARVPAVVLIHGSGGISGSMDFWVRELNGIGLATFVLDTLTGRGIVSTVQDQNQLHSLAMTVDAYRALDRLAEHPRILADRIAVMGFSKGAVPAVYSAMERFRRLHGSGDKRFAAHIGLYTPCNVTYAEDTRVAPAPIRMYHGIADDYVAIEPCRDYASRLRAAGADAGLTEYPDAQHGFDNPLSPRLVPVPTAQTTRGCRLSEGPGGSVLNASGAPYVLESDPCVGRGAHVGHNPEATVAVRAAVSEFLRTTLLR